MKITFVLPYAGLSGGVRVAMLYAVKLRERGHDVTVISAPRGRPPLARRLRAYRADPRKLLSAFNPFRAAKARSAPQPHAYLQGADIRHVVLDRNRPVTDADAPDADVVVATWWETAFSVCAPSPAKGRKFYLVQHHEVHPHLPWHLAAGSYWLPLKKIVVSSWLAKVMCERYRAADATLVLNSVDFERFDAPPRAQGAPLTVGFLYALQSYKGVRGSIAAIEAARRRWPDLQVVAFGAIDPHPDLPLPAGTRYVRQPDQAAIPGIYASCDVWIWGSSLEGFGLPILEAMACRCVVVSTRTGGATDFIEDGVNGFLVEPDDGAGLAAAL